MREDRAQSRAKGNNAVRHFAGVNRVLHGRHALLVLAAAQSAGALARLLHDRAVSFAAHTKQATELTAVRSLRVVGSSLSP